MNVWFDGNDDTLQGASEPSDVAQTDASGAFAGVKLLVKSSPGQHFIRAGNPAVALTAVRIGTCWFMDEGCFIDGRQTICLIGDSPSDFLSDCKVLDASYTDASTGYNLGNTGVRVAGAGVLAAAVNDLGPPGTGCAAMLAAIASAQALGNQVPGIFDLFKPTQALTDIACGPPFGPAGFVGFDLFSYIAVETLAGHGADPAIQDAIEFIAPLVAIAPGLGLPVAQEAFAQAAVSGAIACGYVDYFCNGSDITANILLNPNNLQSRLIPLLIPGVLGKRWGDIIGWAIPVCAGLLNADDNTLPLKKPDGTYETGSCEQSGHVRPNPGSAGPVNTLATPTCTTGKVVGMSIGYDGDISFDVNDGPDEDAPGPGIAPLTNYHNFQPGPGGSDPPGGVDVEIPVSDVGRFLPQIIALRKGMTVTVCGRWVTDMHQLWNELHPVTSLTIHAAAKTPPTVTPIVTGTLGQNGWYTSDVTVTWDLSASHPAVTSSSGCGTTTITADTAGQTLTCTATSDDGTTTQPLTIKRDATPPTIGHGVSPPLNGTNGWYVTAPTVTFSCADSRSGVQSCFANGISTGSVTLGEDANPQTVTGVATDNAGNVAQDSLSLLVDLSNPTISAALSRAPNANGWFNASVDVNFSCADAISGVAFCPAATLGEGADQSVSGTVMDVAGRTASTSLSHINIDTTAPVVTFSGNAGTYTVDQTVDIACSASDALSGLASSTCAGISGPAYSFGAGNTTRSATATDLAGNTGSGSTSFTVVVTPASLDALIARFFGANQNGVNGLFAKVNSIATASTTNARSGALSAFGNDVDAKIGNPLTAAQAAILKQLAAAL